MNKEIMMGFRNAPEITEFAVGMRVCLSDDTSWKTVILVEGDHVHCRNDDESYVSLHFKVSDYILDLDSIWVGREYRFKGYGFKAEVLTVGNGRVGYVEEGTTFCCLEAQFRERYEPVPLAKGEPTTTDYLAGHKASGIKVGDRVKVLRKAEGCEGGWLYEWSQDMSLLVGEDGEVVYDHDSSGFAVQFEDNWWLFPYFVLEKVEKSDDKAPCDGVAQEWRPKVGEECISVAPELTHGLRVTPVVFDNTYRQHWLCYGPTMQVLGIKEECLRPLPPAPSVKVCPHCGK